MLSIIAVNFYNYTTFKNEYCAVRDTWWQLLLSYVYLCMADINDVHN